MPVKKTPGSITHTADAMDDRINNISSVSKTINGMQRDVDQKISETREEVIKGSEVDAIHSSMNQTLGQLNNTIGALSSGIKTITVDTAKATKDAISSYGRAISEDISFNKKSVVAMALAKTSPLYGYFVAKFVESDVWKKAMSRMAQSVSRTMGAIVRPFKGRPAMEKGIPQLKNGGYIQQGGMANLHAGETVTPAGGGAGLNQLVELQQKQLIYLRSVFGVVRYKEPGMWGRFVNTMGAPLRFVNRFRKTQGVYTSGLSSSKQPLVNIAQNIATLYSSLMWRLDNMTNIMIANAIANRDLTMHTIGKGYPAIKGVRTRQLVRPRARKLLRLGMKAMPYAAGLLGAGMGGLGGAGLLAAGIGGRMLTRKAKDVAREEEETGKRKGLGVLGFLGRERGMYRGIEEEGFVSGKLRRLRESWLPKRSELVSRRGGMAGTGIGGATRMTLMNTGPQHLADMIGTSIREALGGRKGRRKPVWMARIPSSEQKKVWKKTLAIEGKQTKALKVIKESTKDTADVNKSLLKKFKDFVFWTRIFGFLSAGLSGIWGFLKTIMVPGGLLKWLGLAAAAGGIGYTIGSWIDENFFKEDREKFRKFMNKIYGEISARENERNMNEAQFIADESKPFQKRLQMAGAKERKHALTGFGKFKDVREKSIGGGWVKNWVGFSTSWIPIVNEAQQEYMMKHSGLYSMYSVDEIDRMREKFSTANKFRSLSLLEVYNGRPAVKKYGVEREAAFLKYLQDHGTKLRSGEVGSKAERQVIKAAKKKGIDVQLPKRKPLTMADKLRHAKNTLESHIQSSYSLNSARAGLLATKIMMAAMKTNAPAAYWTEAENLISFGDGILKSIQSKGGYGGAILQKMEGGLLASNIQQFTQSAVSDFNSRAIPPEAIYKAEVEAKAGEATTATKKNTDAIDHNTMALKQESKKARDSNVNVSNQQTTAINNVLQSSHSSSSGGGGGGSDYWADVNLKMGQGH